MFNLTSQTSETSTELCLLAKLLHYTATPLDLHNRNRQKIYISLSRILRACNYLYTERLEKQ